MDKIPRAREVILISWHLGSGLAAELLTASAWLLSCCLLRLGCLAGGWAQGPGPRAREGPGPWGRAQGPGPWGEIVIAWHRDGMQHCFRWLGGVNGLQHARPLQGSADYRLVGPYFGSYFGPYFPNWGLPYFPPLWAALVETPG